MPASGWVWRRRDSKAMRNARPILVIGRAGQLARCLVDEARAGDMLAVARGRPEFDLADVDAAEHILAEIEPQAVVNAAAYTAVDQAETEAAKAFAINRDGAARLAAAAARYGVPFVHVSTDYVFDGRKAVPYDEEDAPAPLNVYGRSKLEGEIAVRTNHPAAVIVRTSSVYSPYGHNFVRTMLRLAETRDVLRVVEDQKAAPTFAADLARAMLTIVQQIIGGGARGGVYHLAGGGATSWFDFASAIFASSARRGNRVPKLEPIAASAYPTAAVRPANSVLDCHKVERTFGLRLPAWQDSLEACLDRITGVSRENARC
jgi:dTDP-4-dehydrorhamnose reductase